MCFEKQNQGGTRGNLRVATAPCRRVHCLLDPLVIQVYCLEERGGMWIAWVSGWCIVALFLWSQIEWIRAVIVQQTHHPHRIEFCRL